MRRRDFIKKGTIAAGLASSVDFLSLPANGSSQPSPQAGTLPDDNRSADYGRAAQDDAFVPKPPEFAASLRSSDVKISPMPLEERLRRKLVPRRGFCSIEPGNGALICGNGTVSIELEGDPYTEQIPFRHELLYPPRRRPFEAPKIAEIFPQVRQMLLDGKYHEAAALGYQKWHEFPLPGRGMGFGGGSGFSLRLEFPKGARVTNYLRTVDFESTELKVHWTDERGEWVRRTFASRPDNLVVQLLQAPKGQSVNVRITLSAGAGGLRGGRGGLGGFGGDRPVDGTGQGNAQIDLNEQRLIYKGRLDPAVDNRGYGAVTRVVRDGGSTRIEGKTLIIENASSVLLLTRVEYFPDYSEDRVEAVREAVEKLNPDYSALLERARKVQSEMFNRVSIDFGGVSKHGLSSEELLSDQRSSPGYSGAFLEALFGMCRYWFILTTGKYCSMSAEVNANINLQLAPMALGFHREGEQAFFNWMESLISDFRTNAKNIFGMRGTHYSLTPSKEFGVETMYDHAGSAATGEVWPHPYWLAGGPWCVRPFWDHYLVTGDLDFLRNRVVPAYKELALFYEDFLTVTDKNGNYIFVPSFSPENSPGNLNPSCMLVINSSMDIAVCREVLANLVEACELLGLEADSVPKWKGLLAKLPPYLIEPDGALKEWAWPTLAERYVQRHISHLYGAWPGDEIDPDRTPQLAKAAVIANRHRVPERLAAHGRCHRALVGARLKDCYMVDSELRQLIEEGYVGPTLRCSHDPYSNVMPDAQGGIPTIIMEMLVYSRPGIIEVLPALPPSLVKGSISGMLLRAFARLDWFAWDMSARTVDLKITSTRKQEVTLLARYGIEAASGSLKFALPSPHAATFNLTLPKARTVELHLKLGRRNPLDWIKRVV
jgi:alpha-L-fucosidase 2